MSLRRSSPLEGCKANAVAKLGLIKAAGHMGAQVVQDALIHVLDGLAPLLRCAGAALLSSTQPKPCLYSLVLGKHPYCRVTNLQSLPCGLAEMGRAA